MSTVPISYEAVVYSYHDASGVRYIAETTHPICDACGVVTTKGCTACHDTSLVGEGKTPEEAIRSLEEWIERTVDCRCRAGHIIFEVALKADV